MRLLRSLSCTARKTKAAATSARFKTFLGVVSEVTRAVTKIFVSSVTRLLSGYKEP